MKYVQFGQQQVPAIGLGTYKMLGPEAVIAMRQALELGYRHIDTAQLYGNEKEVGTAIIKSRIPREEIFVTTKVWPSNLDEERFMPSVEESLRNLQMDYVDLLLIHWPHHQYPVAEYVQRLMDAQQKGYARHIGVSNFNIQQIKQALKTGAEIVTNQVEFHPWINQTKLHEWMIQNGLPLTAYCPLGQGRFMTDKKLLDMAADHLKSPGQIILRWMMQKTNVVAIPKTMNYHRLVENISVFDFTLSEEEMAIIDAWRLENQRVVDEQAGAKFDK